MTTYATKHYNSSQTGAPVVSGTAGAGIAWLDAMLLNGFNSKSVTSLSRTSTTATLGLVAHGFVVGDCIAISGVTNDTNWNGEYIILTATADQMTFTVPGTLDENPTGTIVIKYPPISTYWSKVFTGTNQAIYKSTHPLATGWFLRVDDSNAYRMAVSIIEGYSSFTTGLLNQSDRYWFKSDAASGAARSWTFVGDALRFYPMVSWSTYSNYMNTNMVMDGNFFGDIIPTKPGDGYHCACIGTNNSNHQNESHNMGQVSYNSFVAVDNSNAAGAALLRSYTQLGAQVGFTKYSLMATNMMGYSGFAYPNPSDNGVYIDSIWIIQGGGFRGKMPGLWAPTQAIRFGLPTWDETTVKNGKIYMYVRTSSATADYYQCGGCFFDITYDTTGWTL